MTALSTLIAAMARDPRRSCRARGPHHDHVLAPYKPSIGKPWALFSYGRIPGSQQPETFASAEAAAAAFVEAVGERRALAAASGRVAMRPAPPSQPPIT